MSDETTTPAEPAEPAQPAPAAEPVRSRRGAALRASAVLVAAALLGSYCYTVVRGKHHDRDAARPAATWTAPTPSATRAFGAKSGGAHYGDLSLLLLPIPDDYDPGPDIKAYGNDAVLTAHQAADLIKTDSSGPTAKGRKELDASVDALHVEGAGLRTYTHHDNDLVVQLSLIQMRNQRAAQAEPRFFAEYARTLGGFRRGPKVPGHAQAVCLLPKLDADDELGMMLCQATEGDLLVKMNATGTAPLDQAAAVDLLRRQLDRIQDPGESV
ncbi:hypothetical protein V2S66_27690 [Streptomyces sp. V4-01]|uniref:Secreted protein n=1 Tax=Actinacidiphila polyblastidii TaxID=3110430 RepID=A0ABU7PIT9_9ACTN|nr:hypothetical protein [Streptomyces sp. V4-01]